MIKFRAWYHKHESMYSVASIDLALECITVLEDDYVFDFEEVALMQSTGLKDQNGVDIFEGDIVKIKQQEPIDKYIPNNSNNEIVYKDSAFCVKETWKISDIQWPIVAGLYYKVSEEFEVIGNIYENPELLEVAE